jgi:long-chain acyl-CoA synthetase
MHIIKFIAQTGGKSPNHHLRYWHQGQACCVTLDQLDRKAGALAQALLEAGLQPRQRIGILARNGLPWILLDLAALKAGFITAGFEYGRMRIGPDEVARYELDAAYIEDGGYCQPDCLDIAAIVQAHVESDGDALPAWPENRVYSEDDVTTIKFTSGSTGTPKAMAARAGSINQSLAVVQEMFSHGERDNLLVFLPLSLLQQRYWVYSALAFAHDVTVTTFERAYDVACLTQPTVIMGVPAFYDGIRKRVLSACSSEDSKGAQRKHELMQMIGPNVRYLWTGSAPGNPATLAFFESCAVPLLEGYGMNETCVVSKNHPGAHRLGSVGKPLPHQHAWIDEDGVLCVRSEQPVNTRYAYCAPGDNEAMFLPDGAVRTGDLARFDEDGYLYILGRADDMVVLGNGRNVHTRAIADTFKSSTIVHECLVCGSGKAYLIALLSLNVPATDERTLMELLRHVNANLPADQRIGKIIVAPEPFSQENGLLTSQFKPRRKAILAAYANQIERAYEVAA